MVYQFSSILCIVPTIEFKNRTNIFPIYNETCLNRTFLTCACLIQNKLIKICYIGTVFKDWFIHDFSLFRVRHRQVSPHLYKDILTIVEIHNLRIQEITIFFKQHKLVSTNLGEFTLYDNNNE